ncbi:histidine kinase OS=Streptomyces microflavus OX=1919 GN=Smic_37290 PE=4 SV=1 [Streptomyces microflavus]
MVLIPDELLTTEVPQPAAPAEAPETYDAYGTQQEPEAAQPDRWQQAPAPAPTPLFPPADRRPDTATQQLAQITTTSGGLPKRRRKSPVSAVPPAAPQPVRSNEETASRLGAFQRGTRSGRDTTTTTEGSEIQ